MSVVGISLQRGGIDGFQCAPAIDGSLKLQMHDELPKALTQTQTEVHRLTGILTKIERGRRGNVHPLEVHCQLCERLARLATAMPGPTDPSPQLLHHHRAAGRIERVRRAIYRVVHLPPVEDEQLRHIRPCSFHAIAEPFQSATDALSVWNEERHQVDSRG